MIIVVIIALIERYNIVLAQIIIIHFICIDMSFNYAECRQATASPHQQSNKSGNISIQIGRNVIHISDIFISEYSISTAVQVRS